MTLKRRPVERAHLRTLFRLKVRTDQNDLVAPNEITLAQAAYEPGSHVWGLWVDDESHAAFGFYENCGFIETGRVVEDEREMKRDV